MKHNVIENYYLLLLWRWFDISPCGLRTFEWISYVLTTCVRSNAYDQQPQILLSPVFCPSVHGNQRKRNFYRLGQANGNWLCSDWGLRITSLSGVTARYFVRSRYQYRTYSIGADTGTHSAASGNNALNAEHQVWQGYIKHCVRAFWKMWGR
jgi:hypothetical protein